MRLYDHPTYGSERPGPQAGRVMAHTQSWGGLAGWPSAHAPLSTAPKIVADIVAKQPVSTLIQTGVQGIGKFPAALTESAPTSDAPAASRFAMTRPGIAVPVVADQPFQLSGGDDIQGEFTQAPGPGTFTPSFAHKLNLSGVGQDPDIMIAPAWHSGMTTFRTHPYIWGGIALALGCCLWKKFF
jgi:hypothetical protein